MALPYSDDCTHRHFPCPCGRTITITIVAPPSVPATEKPRPRCIHDVALADWCYRCSDRRKGIRRMGTESRGVFAEGDPDRFGRNIYHSIYNGSWKYDRRSGKDRRCKN